MGLEVVLVHRTFPGKNDQRMPFLPFESTDVSSLINAFKQLSIYHVNSPSN